jgi:hypothetical protein
MLVVLMAAAARAADDEKRIAGDKQMLSAVQSYVGGWRGVGQLRRGSSRGAWTEGAEWSWRFADGRAELVADLERSKYYSRLQLQAGDEPGQFVLLATPVSTGAEGRASPQRFTGKRENGALVLSATSDPGEDLPARITIRLVAQGDRMVVLYEKRLGDSYARLAEVGATRKGSSFAQASASGPECIVTGGLGTIAVEYEGKKYFVCCTGCRDLFNDDPAGVLAEYRQRKEEEKADKGEK